MDSNNFLKTILIVTLVIVLSHTASADTLVNGCQTITQSGVYNLTQNISNGWISSSNSPFGMACFVVNGLYLNVVINLNGFTVDGGSVSGGVAFLDGGGNSNVSVENGFINNVDVVSVSDNQGVFSNLTISNSNNINYNLFVNNGVLTLENSYFHDLTMQSLTNIATMVIKNNTFTNVNSSQYLAYEPSVFDYNTITMTQPSNNILYDTGGEVVGNTVNGSYAIFIYDPDTVPSVVNGNTISGTSIQYVFILKGNVWINNTKVYNLSASGGQLINDNGYTANFSNIYVENPSNGVFSSGTFNGWDSLNVSVFDASGANNAVNVNVSIFNSTSLITSCLTDASQSCVLQNIPIFLNNTYLDNLTLEEVSEQSSVTPTLNFGLNPYDFNFTLIYHLCNGNGGNLTLTSNYTQGTQNCNLNYQTLNGAGWVFNGTKNVENSFSLNGLNVANLINFTSYNASWNVGESTVFTGDVFENVTGNNQDFAISTQGDYNLTFIKTNFTGNRINLFVLGGNVWVDNQSVFGAVTGPVTNTLLAGINFPPDSIDFALIVGGSDAVHLYNNQSLSNVYTALVYGQPPYPTISSVAYTLMAPQTTTDYLAGSLFSVSANSSATYTLNTTSLALYGNETLALPNVTTWWYPVETDNATLVQGSLLQCPLANQCSTPTVQGDLITFNVQPPNDATFLILNSTPPFSNYSYTITPSPVQIASFDGKGSQLVTQTLNMTSQSNQQNFFMGEWFNTNSTQGVLSELTSQPLNYSGLNTPDFITTWCSNGTSTVLCIITTGQPAKVYVDGVQQFTSVSSNGYYAILSNQSYADQHWHNLLVSGVVPASQAYPYLNIGSGLSTLSAYNFSGWFVSSSLGNYYTGLVSTVFTSVNPSNPLQPWEVPILQNVNLVSYYATNSILLNGFDVGNSTLAYDALSNTYNGRYNQPLSSVDLSGFLNNWNSQVSVLNLNGSNFAIYKPFNVTGSLYISYYFKVFNSSGNSILSAVYPGQNEGNPAWIDDVIGWKNGVLTFEEASSNGSVTITPLGASYADNTWHKLVLFTNQTSATSANAIIVIDNQIVANTTIASYAYDNTSKTVGLMVGGATIPNGNYTLYPFDAFGNTQYATSHSKFSNVYVIQPVLTPPLPANVNSYYMIYLTNNQNIATLSGFQQMIDIPSTVFNGLANTTSFQNVEFFYGNGTVIPSWLESFNSTDAVYWITPGALPANSVTTVYVGFGSQSTNFFNGVTVGEAPQLSSTYGQYDNGANIFGYYQNWAGTTAPANWSASTGMSVTINNGLSLYSSGWAQIYKYNGIINNPVIVESYVNFNSVPSNFDILYDTATNSLIGKFGGTTTGITRLFGYTLPTNFAVTLGYQIFGIQYLTNYSVTTYNYVVEQTATNTPSSSSSGWEYYVDLQDSANVYWFRTRSIPPNGVMPSVSFVNPNTAFTPTITTSVYQTPNPLNPASFTTILAQPGIPTTTNNITTSYQPQWENQLNLLNNTLVAVQASVGAQSTVPGSVMQWTFTANQNTTTNATMLNTSFTPFNNQQVTLTLTLVTPELNQTLTSVTLPLKIFTPALTTQPTTCAYWLLGSGCTNPTLNITTLDEENNFASVVENITGNLYTTNLNQNWSLGFQGNTPLIVYSSPKWGWMNLTGQFYYYSPPANGNYSYLYNYVRNILTNGNLKNIQLYTSNQTDFFQVTITSTAGVVLGNDYLQFQRWYPASNAYITVATCLTNSQGQCNINLNGNNVWYKVVVLDQSFNPLGVIPPFVPACTSNPCTIGLVLPQNLNYWNYLGGVSTSCTVNNQSNTVTCTYTDNSGILISMNLVVQKLNLFNTTQTICNQTLNTASGTLTCPISSNGTYTYLLYGDYNPANDPPVLVDSGVVSIGQAFAAWGGLGLIVAFLLVLIISLVGAWKPTAAIMLAILGILVSMVLGAFEIGIGGLVGLIVTLFVIMIKMRE